MIENHNQRILIGLILLIGILLIGWQVASKLTARLAAQSSLANVSLDQPFTMRIGDTAKLVGPDVSIVVDSVTDDSRCPEGTKCAWEGQAIVKVKVSVGKESNTLDFISRPGGDMGVAHQQVNGYSIKLQKLDPYPANNKQIQEQKYRATFIVSGM